MQLPDYDGRGIVNLMASLQHGLGGGEHPYAPSTLLPPQRIGAHRQVLLLVIDGLGLNYLRAHPRAANLNRHLAGGITSVFPPTTASAITTFLTGDAPQQHGLTGWHMYFRELGAVLAVLPGRARYGGVGLGEAGIDVARLFGHHPFAERIGVPAYAISPAAIAGSDFNRAHLGRACSIAYQDLDDMVERCIALAQAPGPKYVYAYWPGLDSLGHEAGIWSDAARAHLLALDAAFARLLKARRGTDTLVVACADHGQVDVPEDRRIELDDHPALADCLALPLCGESRAAYCYLKPDRAAAFDDYVATALAGRLASVPAAETISAGWFGRGTPHAALADRVGDRVLVAKEDFAIKDWLAQEARHRMIGAHGGLSDDELWVPLILAEA
jgi:hypothetical protein